MSKDGTPKSDGFLALTVQLESQGFTVQKVLGQGSYTELPIKCTNSLGSKMYLDAIVCPQLTGIVSPAVRLKRVAVMDGFSLIVSREFLDKNGGFDTNLPPHHMYDNHTCMQAIDLGYQNIVISMDALHRGGMTDVHEEWNDVFGKSKADIHRDAHYPYFYNYWSPESAEKRKAEGKLGITLPHRS